MRARLRLTLLAGLICPALACATARLAERVDDPLPFGYVVGDTLTRRIAVELDAAAALDASALPKPGRVNGWLELRGVALKQRRALTTRGYDLTLTYQIMKAPREVETLSLPEVALRLAGEDKPARFVPEWPFTVAPLTPQYVLASHGLEELRPSLPSPLLATQPIRVRLALYGAALCALLGYLAYRKFGLPWLARNRGPFARAYRAASRERSLPELAKRVHQAFNETAGRTLLASALESFYVEQPRFAARSERIGAFFQASQRAFFAGAEADPRVERAVLLALCRELRDCERGIA